MSRLFAYSATQAGIARLARERQAPALTVEARKAERVSAPAPVANVVRLVIPRTKAQQIIHDVAQKHGLTYDDLIGHRRYRHIVPARDEAITAVRALAKDGDKWSFSLHVVGRLFGGRDHTSVLTALRRQAKRGLAT